MKFLCLAYYDEAGFNALSEEQRRDLVSKCPPYDADLRKTGRLLMSASLQESKDTICIRPKSGKPTFTDGPFTEAKEMEEAMRIASNHPAAHLGEHVGWAVEVRPIGIYRDTHG